MKPKEYDKNAKMGEGKPKVNQNAICKHFLEGKCKYGNNCHFAHVVVIAPIVMNGAQKKE